LPLLRVPPGRFRLDAEASDFAGNRATASVALVVNEETAPAFYLAGGCSVSRRYGAGWPWPALFVALLVAWRVRRKER
jgi:hypothetical protein